MAGYGASSPLWAPFAGEEPENTEPVYGTGITIGKLVNCGVTPNNAEGKLAANNATAEYVAVIIDEDISLETDDLFLERALKLYDAKMEGNDIKFTRGDNPPLGGYAFYHTAMRNGIQSYIGHFFPKVRAARGARTFATRGDTITFATSTIALKAMFTNRGTVELESEPFSTEEAAYAWCAQKLNIGNYYTVDVSEHNASDANFLDHTGKVFLPEGESFTLSITGYADVMAAFDNGVDIASDITGGTGIYTIVNVNENHDIVVVF